MAPKKIRQRNVPSLDGETSFMVGMMKLHYGLQQEDMLRTLSAKIDWAQGWPDNDVSFWNAEAFMWSYKISKERRDLIKQDLLNFGVGENNLDLGCGAYSYVKSVGVDFSRKMLDLNENCLEKIKASLEEQLPLDKKFNSITAIFVLNYVKNLSGLLSEVKRLLSDGGHFYVVLAKELNPWQAQKSVHNFSDSEWLRELSKHFKVDSYEKEGLMFFKCPKTY